MYGLKGYHGTVHITDEYEIKLEHDSVQNRTGFYVEISINNSHNPINHMILIWSDFNVGCLFRCKWPVKPMVGLLNQLSITIWVNLYQRIYLRDIKSLGTEKKEHDFRFKWWLHNHMAGIRKRWKTRYSIYISLCNASSRLIVHQLLSTTEGK